MLCHLVFTRHEFERYGRIDCYDLVTALFSDEQWYKKFTSQLEQHSHSVLFKLCFFYFWQVAVFRRLLPCWKEENLFCACSMSNTFFIFFEIWARHRLLGVPRLPREKVSARLNFAAPVPIFVTFTRQKAEVPCLKFWARVPIFRGAVPKTLVV